ncbi:RHS repeat-associated core domain-containing protein, partial [Vibrio parahaemolyticus]
MTSVTTRCYTGQEHIQDVGLVNYNARIYDPALARFMSADPVVED